jgi:hypothetical protein
LNPKSVDILDESVLVMPYDTFERLRSAGPVHFDQSLNLFFGLWNLPGWT